MLRSIEGIYREGKVELVEPVPEGVGERVIVTFLSGAALVDLARRGIDQQHAADLRRRLAVLTEDWQRPEMDVYDTP